MATFLELCAELARESGAIGTAPTAVTGQTGRQAKCVEWIRDAWKDIQTGRTDWDFLRAELEATALTAGTKRYSGEALGLEDLAEWIAGDELYSLYVDGEQELESHLQHISYERWKRSYDFRTHDQGRPVYYAIAPNGDLCLGPTPDAAYLIRGEYRRTPQILEANGDLPIAPVRFHSAITAKAELLLLEHDEAWGKYPAAQRKFESRMHGMVRDCLPSITTGGNTIG